MRLSERNTNEINGLFVLHGFAGSCGCVLEHFVNTKINTKFIAF